MDNCGAFWYAMYVKTEKEEFVKERLNNLFLDKIKAYVPKRILLERKSGIVNRVEKILFPGYVFLFGKLNLDCLYQFKSISNIYKLLKEDLEPAIIPEYQIDVFKHLMTDDLIGISDCLIENDNVIIVDGPLLALKGHIIKIDKRKCRAKVAINLLGNVKIVDLGINIISKI